MSNQTTTTTTTLAACPVQNVTVFVDRAQITRQYKFEPTQAGENILNITGLTQSVENDSLRLKVIEQDIKQDGDEKESKKLPEVTIVEVTLDTHHRVKDKEAQSEREQEARAALKRIEEKETALHATSTRLRKQNELVQNYLNSMLTSSGGEKGGGPPVGADLDAVTKLLSFHETRIEETDKKLAAIENELTELRKAKAVANAELAQLSRSASSPSLITLQDITAILRVPEGVKQVLLSIQYIVKDAFWTPSYDLRYDTKQGGLPNSLVMTYYGVVKQSTGEDWKDVSLSLSTASPARGGAPPQPPTRIAQIRVNRTRYVASPTISSYSNARVPQQAMMATEGRKERRLSTTAHELDDVDDDVPASLATVVGKDGGTNATFIIERKSNILSDNKEHKVTIGIIPLKCEVRFFTTPQLEQHAYLQTRLTNTSNYPFLESEMASVFIDGSFIAKTKIELTAPNEQFNLFLGVDSSIKVEHRTIKNTTTKGKEGKMLAKKEPSKTLIDYRTILHNTKGVAVEITVVELCPRTSDERVVVEVLQPTGLSTISNSSDAPASGEGQLRVGGVMQNKITNNVVFSRLLQPGEKLELPFSYSISWPYDAGDVEVV